MEAASISVRTESHWTRQRKSWNFWPNATADATSAEWWRKVKVFIRGWLGYFHVADMKRTMKSWDEWLRRRFRMYIWKQWKKPRTKVANLRKLGIPADKAYQWGNSRLGYWRIAGSPVLECSITNERLEAAGYFSILNCYESLHSCDWTAVYRSVRTVVWEVGSTIYLGETPTRLCKFSNWIYKNH